MAESTEIARFSQEAVAEYTGGDFSSLFSNADEKVGFDLLEDELFDELVGVPFGILKGTFRPGNLNAVTKREGAYVSLECMIGDEESLKQRKIDVSTKPFAPGGLVVVNDGSTGIYRDFVKYLWRKEYIKLPSPIVESGPSGTCSFDLRPDEWEEIFVGSGHADENGFVHYSVNVRLRCPRGIRISDGYSNEYTKDGKTRYLA